MLLVLFSHLISYSRSAHARTPKRERERKRERFLGSHWQLHAFFSLASCLAFALHLHCTVARISRPSDLTPSHCSIYTFIHARTHEASEIPTHPQQPPHSILETRSKQILPMYIIPLSLSLSLFVWFGLVWFSSVFFRALGRHCFACMGFLVLDLN